MTELYRMIGLLLTALANLIFIDASRMREHLGIGLMLLGLHTQRQPMEEIELVIGIHKSGDSHPT